MTLHLEIIYSKVQCLASYVYLLVNKQLSHVANGLLSAEEIYFPVGVQWEEFVLHALLNLADEMRRYERSHQQI